MLISQLNLGQMSKKKQNYYSDEFKLRVVREVLSGRFTKEEARKVYGIASNCAILYWMRQFSGIDNYRNGGEPSLEPSTIIEMKDLNINERRIKELEEELKRERIRADLWQKVVEIAEDQLDIDIIKKYGAKQSIPSKNKKEDK
jgi:transposase-like protein